MKPHAHRRHLLIFARPPVAGEVKTRLIPALGEARATAVYRKMLHDTLSTSARAGADSVELWTDRPDPTGELESRAAALGISVHRQTGPDLGVRMQAAFIDTLGRANRAVLIGTDCPEYDVAYLDAAFAALGRHDAVFGPAHDGGYVLIGLNEPAPSLFHDMPWGTGDVAAETRTRLRQLQWRWQELPAKQDVDYPEDLTGFPHLHAIANAQHTDRTPE